MSLHSDFSETHKIGNIGMNVNFALPYSHSNGAVKIQLALFAFMYCRDFLIISN